MAVRTRTELITGTSPSSATSAAIGSVLRGLQDYDWFTIDAVIIGGTGGTIDVTLQRKIGALTDGTAVDLWVDWLHFSQVAAGTTTKFSAMTGASTTIATVGMVAAAVFTTTLAAGTFVGGHPGQELRAVCTAGAGTSVGATQKIYVTMWNAKVS
jgi:urocanate hydratase